MCFGANKTNANFCWIILIWIKPPPSLVAEPERFNRSGETAYIWSSCKKAKEKGRAEDEPMHDGEFNAYKIRLQTPCGLHRPAGERALLGPPMLKAIFAATFLLAQALRQAHQAIGAARAMEVALFEKCILQVIRSGFFHERQYYRFHLQYKPATFDKHLFLFYIWHK